MKAVVRIKKGAILNGVSFEELFIVCESMLPMSAGAEAIIKDTVSEMNNCTFANCDIGTFSAEAEVYTAKTLADAAGKPFKNPYQSKRFQ